MTSDCRKLATLGLVGKLVKHTRPENFDKLVRYLSSWSGTDKFFMLIQYISKLVIWSLNKSKKADGLSTRMRSLSALVGDHRVLLRLWAFRGLLPMLQWAESIESERKVSKLALNVERLQALSMIAYYPLEHTWYLAHHGVLPVTPSTSNKIAVWSCRFWMLYTVLQLVHNWDDHSTLLKDKERDLSEEKGVNRFAIDKKLKGIVDDTIINLAYLPLTLHWSLPAGIFSNDAWVGLFGSIAAVTQFKVGYTNA
ncbi:hypothetical protein E3Q16_02280 [Wallemia mellicola]|uniref:Peroxisomal biogenesis factor 11 n=1 Tax=Wallemia mellicola TaxID=1708541 RepID=A0AB38MU34_9BASI|nr:hypothetical protein E3Q24_02794 [Wallemia mellicola]TIB83239.1 hypothetical protein E3Q21_02990 [Wallemia mellicola]TIB86044.1 hypothetical protein E3Q20_02981 [Wallemia mellicola]TIC05221.1 hypothetical protein E3Q16_02280 [Wallemia mellicola]TIC35493.1 hypothetical protein E3Q09_02197 [Wallemia mellicola]